MPGGKLTLRTSAEEISGARWVKAWVEDNGIGIAQENIERIFDLDYTTRPEGTVGGFGLYWVRCNVERIGGRIIVNSIFGKGTTFFVDLPLYDEEVDSR